MKSVYIAVRTGSLNKAVWALSLKGLIYVCMYLMAVTSCHLYFVSGIPYCPFFGILAVG